ncbi:putative reverse transcriptase domain-containing protein [Tanacetum coccineum]
MLKTTGNSSKKDNLSMSNSFSAFNEEEDVENVYDESANLIQNTKAGGSSSFTAVAAVKVLSSSGVASYCDDTIKALEAKHPYKPPPSMPSKTFSEPPLVAKIHSVFGCIKLFPKCTSCGRDGLRAQHILDDLCGKGSATATDLLKAITSVVILWLARRCPPILAEFVASVPLTPLLKLDNEIRPIAVGTIWRWLVSKVAMKGVGKEMSKYLGDFQFGVGVLGGVEAVLHSVNRLLSEYHNNRSLAMLTVDFSKAFNLVDRSESLQEVRVRCPSIFVWVDFLYGQATRLYIGDTHIWSATRVQQGDPLGPFLFALVLHLLVHKIRDTCKLLLHAWYLDDGTVIRDSEEVTRVLDIIKVSGPGLGLELNIKKTKIFWPSCNGVKLREGLFPVDIRRPYLGVKLLGGAVSRDTYFISGMAMRRAANAVDLMSLLPQLHDPHSELLLLRSCMDISKLFFGLRTCQPVHMEEATLFFDKGLRGSIDNIVAKVVSSYAFVASRAQSWVLQDHILRDSGICGMDDDYVSALACLRVEYRTILKYRLMIPLFPVDAICPVCHKACLDSFGEHAIHCKELPGFKYRRDMVRDVLFDICRRGGISAKKEAPVNFLTDPSDGRSTLRPTDVLVFEWVGGKHACVDLIEVSPLVGLSGRGFTVGQAALKAASCKVTKHEKSCIENQHVFIPFAFDTFGFLTPEAVELLNRVQRVMNSNVMTPRSTNVVFRKISFAIQKGLAAQLVARLTSTIM